VARALATGAEGSNSRQAYAGFLKKCVHPIVSGDLAVFRFREGEGGIEGLLPNLHYTVVSSSWVSNSHLG